MRELIVVPSWRCEMLRFVGEVCWMVFFPSGIFVPPHSMGDNIFTYEFISDTYTKCVFPDK